MRTIELQDGEKLIGSRDGLFYLDEKEICSGVLNHQSYVLI